MIKTKIFISLIATGLVGGHLFYPGIEVDGVTLALLALGLAPWLAPVIKSLELPGGFKIELQDVQSSARKITARVAGPEIAPEPAFEVDRVPKAVEDDTDSSPTQSHLSVGADLRAIAGSDPNLALVGLRLELERVLRDIARKHDLEADERSAGWLLRRLSDRSILPLSLTTGLGELIEYGNHAAHGAVVSKQAADWALDRAPLIFQALEEFRGD